MALNYEAAVNFIKAISSYLYDCRSIGDFRYAVYAYNREYNAHIIMEHGLTRVVFMKDGEFVVKIDYGKQSYNYGGCRDEYAFYQYAKSMGYDYLFAPIHKFVFHTANYYIMPFINDVDTGEDDVYIYLNDDENNFINENLYDMHSGNYGFEDEDRTRPVIIDYACVRYET